MAEEVTETREDAPAKRKSRLGRAAKWGLGILAAIVLAVVGAVVVLNTPIGERFLASQIAKRTLPNGLNIRIGRIEGDLYGAAVLHDVVLSDPQGPFLTIPRAEIDWNPGGWLYNRLDIDSFTARRAMMTRIPEFLPSEEDGPILPGFDISIDRLEIDNLTLAPGIAGDSQQRVDLVAEVQVEDQRLFVDADGRFGTRDRLALLLDARPDDDQFDISLDAAAAADGAVAGMLGLDIPLTAQIRGQGSWTDWRGALLARSEDRRLAALRITNRSGRFGVLGKIDPSLFLTGLPQQALGDDVALKADIAIEERAFQGAFALIGSGLQLIGNGGVDLAENRADDLDLDFVLRDPDLFGPELRLENTRGTATIDGTFDDLTIVHDVAVGRLVASGTELLGLTQQGTATYDGTRFTLPLQLAVDRITSGNALVDPRLVNGRGQGTLTLSGSRLYGEDLRIAFAGLAANIALRGDLDTGFYRIAGPVRADGLVLDNVGTAGGTAMVTASFGGSAPWRVNADLDARIDPVSNDTLANLAGPSIRVRGGVGTGGGAPLLFDNVRVNAANLQMVLDGNVTGGTTQLAGRGTHVEYGAFTVQARIADSGPEAQLVFANPVDGLENVRVSIAPSEEGFAIQTEGQSLLGPFAGTLGLVSPAGGPTRIDIEQLTVSDTQVRGALTLVDGGAQGSLALTGGGLDGTIDLAPRDGGQGLAVDLTARNARFGGATPLTIASADVQGQGLIAEGRTTFSGEGRAQGISYGSLFIGQMAARGELTNGVGRVDASITGRRGSRFALDLNANIRPDRIAVAADGSFAGRAIEMPRRAVLTRLDDGGWQLAQTQLNFGGGGLLASGRFGGGDTAFEVKLARMPLSLIDLAIEDLGMGGTMSGVVDFSVGPNGLPVGNARVKVDDLTRSGLVLTSRPVDLSLVLRLTENQLETRALLRNEEIRRGRLQAQITGLPSSGGLTERLRAGRLFAQLRYDGAAESLWRLAAIDAFDLTGPVTIGADARGTLADPIVTGTVASDNLRVRSSLSGTDITDVTMRGRFAGSRLQLTRFAGATAGGGRVSGSGIVDLRGLGERVEGRFVEVRGPTLDLRAAADNARLLNANGLSATISGPLRIVSNGLGGTIAGRVRVDQASWRLGTSADDVRLPQISTREINAPSDRAPRVAASRPWRYLIDARASSRIDVDGMGLDSEWGADIILRGTTDDPRIGGSASVVRGDYTFAGTRFELTRGEIDFDADAPIDPRLDILAETDRDGLTVEVAVRGNAMQPEITFSSVPALPEEEILARLLFGGSITSLSATDALQLGAALASLRGGSGMDPINQLRSAIGLDRLRIVGADPALDRGTGVALGKNFGRRFYVELITDGRGYSATELEFRVTSWLSLLASISTVGRESVTAEISRDY